jgi:hypothetical protein
LRLSDSILWFAGLVLSFVDKPTTFDALWRQVRELLDSPDWPAKHGVENFVLALCFLYSVGAIDVSPSSELFPCD